MSLSWSPHTISQVCGGLALGLFRYDELELLVCGLPHLDFNELEKNAKVRNLCGLAGEYGEN